MAHLRTEVFPFEFLPTLTIQWHCIALLQHMKFQLLVSCMDMVQTVCCNFYDKFQIWDKLVPARRERRQIFPLPVYSLPIIFPISHVAMATPTCLRMEPCTHLVEIHTEIWEMALALCAPFLRL